MLCAAGAYPARAETPGYERVISTVTLSFEMTLDDRAVLVDNFDAGPISISFGDRGGLTRFGDSATL